MITNSLAAALAAALLGISTAPYAQTPKSDSSGPLTPERKCDALSGAKKEQCLRDARRLPDSTARSPEVRGSCDALIGPEKEGCLKRGGTIEAGAKSR
jgi:hypothetical protein